jgi:hypothetical protein
MIGQDIHVVVVESKNRKDVTGNLSTAIHDCPRFSCVVDRVKESQLRLTCPHIYDLDFYLLS